jgi:pyruvate,water dikinase
MIASPTFEERPDLLWDLVRKYQGCSSTAADDDDGDDGDAAAGLLADDLACLPLWKRYALRWVAARARTAIAARERGRMVQSLLFGEIRRLVLAIGDVFVVHGRLEHRDDVFCLHLCEVRDLCYGKFLLPETVPELVAVRRAALEQCEAQELPECFVLEEGDQCVPRGRPARPTGAHELRGIGASCGAVEGAARVVLDPVRDNRLQPGEILVARSTDPGWTPLFCIAGGLVTERGGMLSHGAIVAREFGIPAVLGVEGATTLIRDGDRVRVDGRAGLVRIIERAEVGQGGVGPRNRRRA